MNETEIQNIMDEIVSENPEFWKHGCVLSQFDEIKEIKSGDGKLVGFAQVQVFDTKKRNYYSVGIKPQYRRLGLQYKQLKALKDKYSKNGYENCWFVNEKNEKSIQLGKKLGMTLVEYGSDDKKASIEEESFYIKYHLGKMNNYKLQKEDRPIFGENKFLTKINTEQEEMDQLFSDAYTSFVNKKKKEQESKILKQEQERIKQEEKAEQARLSSVSDRLKEIKRKYTIKKQDASDFIFYSNQNNGKHNRIWGNDDFEDDNKHNFVERWLGAPVKNISKGNIGTGVSQLAPLILTGLVAKWGGGHLGRQLLKGMINKPGNFGGISNRLARKILPTLSYKSQKDILKGSWHKPGGNTSMFDNLKNKQIITGNLAMGALGLSGLGYVLDNTSNTITNISRQRDSYKNKVYYGNQIAKRNPGLWDSTLSLASSGLPTLGLFGKAVLPFQRLAGWGGVGGEIFNGPQRQGSDDYFGSRNKLNFIKPLEGWRGNQGGYFD